MKIRRLLFGNLLLKLGALVLAFGIWFVVRLTLAGTATAQFSVELQMETDQYVATILSPNDKRITLHITGVSERTTAFVGLSESQRTATIRIKDDALVEGQNKVPVRINKDQLKFPEALLEGLKIGQMVPAEVVVLVERVETKPKIHVHPPELRGIEDVSDAAFSVAWFPSRIAVHGLSIDLKKLSEVYPFVSAATLEELKSQLGNQTTQTFSVPLELDTARGWKPEFTLVSPNPLMAKIEVTSEKKALFWIPIHIDYRGAKALKSGVLKFVAEAAGPDNWTSSPGEPEPPRVRLPFVGPPRQIERFQELVNDGKVIAFVLANDVDAQDGFANLRVRVEIQDPPRGVIPLEHEFPRVGVETVK